MRFADVGEENLSAAGYVHSESWKESHRGFCSAEFVARHTPEAQTGYLRRELGAALKLRYTPELLFVEDDSIGKGAHILSLLRDESVVKPANPANAHIDLDSEE